MMETDWHVVRILQGIHYRIIVAIIISSTWMNILHSIQLPASKSAGIETTASVGAIAFDTFQELLWIGDGHGWVTSYAELRLDRFTSFRAHEEDEGDVLQFLFNERGVVSVASRSVHFSIRRGLPQWHAQHSSMTQLSCMAFIDKGNYLLVAGVQSVMLKLDASTGAVVEILPVVSQYSMMRAGRYICAATTTGSIDFLDPNTLQLIKAWQAHTASVSDMALSSSSLVSCGRAVRPIGPAMLENFAKVYDLKNLEQLAPIPFPTGAAYVQIHPKLSTTCVLGAPVGQLQVIDLVNPETSNMVFFANSLTHFVMSGSGNLWAVVEDHNIIHLWGSPSKALNFNDDVQLPEYADEIEPVRYLGVDEDIPFSTIGMPHYRDRLLSAWGNEQPWEVGYLPPPIDPDIERNLRSTGFGQYAPNTNVHRRNQAHRKRISNSSSSSTFSAPKLLSEQARASENGHSNGYRLSEAAEALSNLSFSNATRNGVPDHYMNVKIKYGKYGISDFDFRAYNQTAYSGLETDISNHYLNPLLQLFKYAPMIRNPALHHVAGRCIREGCLFCEMGFLFDMLEKADGEVCQATNFLKAFSNDVEAAERGLLEDESAIISLIKRLTDATTFLLNKAILDSGREDPPEYHVERVLTLHAQWTMRCQNCHSEAYNPTQSMVLDMIYPNVQLQSRHRQQHRFSEILRASLSSETQCRGFCPSCRRYPTLVQRRTIEELPALLLIDAAMEHTPASNLQYWSQQNWLPDEIGIMVNAAGDPLCYEGDRLHHLRDNTNVTVYELVGLVADINSTPGQKSHLVAFINVSISEPPRAERDGNEWHMFNDFLVRKVTKEEALRFDTSWKSPVIFAYQMRAYRHTRDDSWKAHPDISCLYNLGSLNHTQGTALGLPLQPRVEIPGPGFHLGIDAEFVSLEKAEVAITIEQNQEIIRPVRQGTGRISALRGSGSQEGVPFIDDYIKIDEPIVDYLTEYSGLFPGDLDASRSAHSLQSLKVAYKKLWLLLNLGCTFVGHGLASDFRTINIHVPKSQIVDTVTLFRPSNEKRRLSLRFLAWYFLDEAIQTGNHDSIVDARTALKLWRKYQEFVEQGILEQKLVEIYRDGPNTGFKPPAEFEALGGKMGKKRRSRREGDSSLLGGRMTPEQGGSGVSSAVGTPAPAAGKRKEGEGYFESPLK